MLFRSVPRGHPIVSKSWKSGDDQKSYMRLKDISELPLILSYKRLRTRTAIDRMFAAAGVHPNILYEFWNHQAIFPLVDSNLGIAISSQSMCLSAYDPAKFQYFYIEGESIKMAVFHPADMALSKASIAMKAVLHEAIPKLFADISG